MASLYIIFYLTLHSVDLPTLYHRLSSTLISMP